MGDKNLTALMMVLSGLAALVDEVIGRSCERLGKPPCPQLSPRPLLVLKHCLQKDDFSFVK